VRGVGRQQRPAGCGGPLVVVSGPSGVGKGAIVSAAMERFPHLRRAVSATTRPPRAGEVEGHSYYFKSPGEFRRMLDASELLEWTDYLGHCYGTPRSELERPLASGEVLVFEVDVNGARSIRAAHAQAVLVFVAPPSWEALAARLRGRHSETAQALARRLELARQELECAHEYDYVIINDRLEDAVDLFCDILRAEQARPCRVDLSRLSVKPSDE